MMPLRSVGPKTSLQNAAVVPIQVPDIPAPPEPNGVMPWLDRVGPLLRALGGHKDDALTGHILRSLVFAKITREVNLATRQYRAANWAGLWDGLRFILIANALGLRHWYGAVFAKARLANGAMLEQTLVSLKLVTNAGADAMVDAFTNTFELENFNFHGVGTGTNAEAVGNTALQTELTTALSPDNTRATGTQSQPSSTIYQTLATTTYDSSQAITEHGIFSQSATGGGTLWDRSVFSVINATSIQHTHQTTITSGG